MSQQAIIFRLSLFALLCLVMSSCFRDIENFNPYDDNFLVSPTLFGFRDAETHKELPRVAINLHDQNVTTDESGTIFFNTARVHKDSGSVALCQKDGYMPHYTFLSLAGKTRTIEKVEMIPDNWTTLTEIDKSIEYQGDNFSLSIPAATFQSNDNTYELNIHYNTISDKLFYNKLSGSNQGVRLNNSRVSILPIASFIAAGNTQFADKNITLTGNISTDILDNITNQLLLWKLNTRTGIYEEVSVVEVVDQKLLTQLTQDGLYLIGSAYPFVTINGSVFYETNSVQYPIQDLKLQLRVSTNLFLEAYTRNDGTYTFFAPQNIDLNMWLLNHCGDIISMVDVSRVATDRTLPPKILKNEMSLLTASFQNCEGELNDNARITLRSLDKWGLLASNKDGIIYSVVDYCRETPARLHFQDDGRQNVDFSTIQALDNSEYDLKNISTCNPPNYILSSPYEKVMLEEADDLNASKNGDVLTVEGAIGDTEIYLQHNYMTNTLMTCQLNYKNTVAEDLAENEHEVRIDQNNLFIQSKYGSGYVHLQFPHEIF